MAAQAPGKINPPERCLISTACDSPTMTATVHEKTGDSDFCSLRGVCGHDSGKHHPLCRFSILYFLWKARTRLRSLARNVDSYMRSFCGEGGLMSGQGEPNI